MPCDVRSFDFKEGFKMNKIVKKAMAAALALTIVGGGAPTLAGGGFDVLKPAIVANAEASTIAPSIGATYHWGDEVKINKEKDVYLKLEDAQSQAGYTIYHEKKDGTYIFKLNEMWTYSSDLCWSKSCNGGDYFPPASGHSIYEIPNGVKIVSGSGTEKDPYLLRLVYENEARNVIGGASLSLGDSTTVNIYASLTSDVEKVVLSGPNGDQIIDDFDDYKQDGGIYKFSYDFYATQLDEKVSVKFYDDEENELKLYKLDNSYRNVHYEELDAFEYGPGDYIDSYLSTAEYDEDEKRYIIEDEGVMSDDTANLVAALKNYGIAAKNYFGGEATGSIDLFSYYDESIYDDDDVNPMHYFKPDFPKESKISLVLDSTTAVRLYIDGASKGDVANYTSDRYITDSHVYYDSDEAVEEVSGNVEAEEGANGIYFEIPNITAISICGYTTLSYGGEKYKFSPLSYCYRVKNRSGADEKTVALSNAFFDYAIYANIYFGSYYDEYAW